MLASIDLPLDKAASDLAARNANVTVSADSLAAVANAENKAERIKTGENSGTFDVDRHLFEVVT